MLKLADILDEQNRDLTLMTSCRGLARTANIIGVFFIIYICKLVVMVMFRLRLKVI